MSFQQGLSGLNSAARNLDVIGNNIANVSTVGFKGARAEFADVFATSLYGSGGVQVGVGTRLMNVAQQFTQGNISITNNPLDVAISGDGFFRLNDGGATVYSRNGQFHLDQDGYLVTNTGANVTGYTTLSLDPTTGAVIGAGDLGNIQVDLGDLEPRATTTMSMVMNLDRDAEIITDPFVATDPTTYNYTTPVTVYDSEGGAHSINFYFTKTALNTWEVNATIAVDADTTDPVTLSSTTLTFNTDGSLATTPTSITATTSTLTAALGVDELNVTVDFTDATTQFAGGSGVSSLNQDGYTRGRIVGLSIDGSGVIYGRYTNNITQPLQQLALASFRNPGALIPLGDNQWAASNESGAEVVNAPGNGAAGAVQSGATEDANVDLTAELVNLIVAQRLYQANAQTIRAQDQVLQTLVNLR